MDPYDFHTITHMCRVSLAQITTFSRTQTSQTWKVDLGKTKLVTNLFSLTIHANLNMAKIIKLVCHDKTGIISVEPLAVNNTLVNGQIEAFHYCLSSFIHWVEARVIVELGLTDWYLSIHTLYALKQLVRNFFVRQFMGGKWVNMYETPSHI